jgi:hypothetical protein
MARATKLPCVLDPVSWIEKLCYYEFPLQAMASIEEFFGSRAGPSDQQFHVLQRRHWMREIIHHYVMFMHMAARATGSKRMAI